MPQVKARIEAVREMRNNSSKKATQDWANRPHLFTATRQPKTENFLAIPEVSSEHRQYIPIGFLDGKTVVSNKIYTIAKLIRHSTTSAFSTLQCTTPLCEP